MKSFSQWTETLASTMAATRAGFQDMGVVPAQEVENIKAGLLVLAEKDPKNFKIIVSKIRGELQGVDRAAAGNIASSAAGKIMNAVKKEGE